MHLCKRKGTLVIVSHDQEFLNTVCTHIVDVKHQKLQMYRGSIDSFREQVVQTETKHQRDYEKQQRLVNQLIKKMKISRKEAKQEIQRGASGRAPQELIEKPRDYLVNFEFTEVTDHRPYIDLKNVSFKYPTKLGTPDTNPWLFKDLTFPVNTST